MIANTVYCDLPDCDDHQPVDPEGLELPDGWVTVTMCGERKTDENQFCGVTHARTWLTAKERAVT